MITSNGKKIKNNYLGVITRKSLDLLPAAVR